jgi:hypothetical protein
MESLTSRQHLFMAAVLQASRRQNSVVDLSAICSSLSIGMDECRELLRWAGKAGLLTDLENHQTILTTAGRALAEELVPIQ